MPISSPRPARRSPRPAPRAAIAVLAAAPYALLAHIAERHVHQRSRRDRAAAQRTPAVLRPDARSCIRSGRRPWPCCRTTDSAGATYIDVSDPQRPAAGAGVSAREAAALGLAGTTTTSTPERPPAYPRPQLEGYTRENRESRAVIESLPFCKDRCERRVRVDLAEDKAVTCETPARKRRAGKRSMLNRGSDGSSWKAAVIWQSSRLWASAAAAPMR